MTTQDMANSELTISRHPHQLWLRSQTWKALRKVKADLISDYEQEPTWDSVIERLCKLYENSK